MSRYTYVSDSQSIIALQGLRMVTKSDSYYASKGGRDAFYLELEYKGLSKKVEYANKEERDKTFGDLVLLLTQRALDGVVRTPFCEHGYNGLCPVCDALQTPPRK
jgi:hypothetical protein